MLARRLTTSGIEQFTAYLQELRSGAPLDPPRELLTAAETSSPIDVEVSAEPRIFRSRLEAAEHLTRILRNDASTLRADAGFWTWLSLYWFEELCPVIRERFQPGEVVRWIADLENPRRACRHLLAGPFQIYRAHRDDPDRAMSLLCGSVHQPGPLVTLIASRPSLVTCHAVVGAATRLYYNRATGRNRSGLSGKGPGSPRRFADILSQLDLTWDLYSLTTDELLDLLPAEFDHFYRGSSVSTRGRQPSLLDP
jgi:hypothetical protein